MSLPTVLVFRKRLLPWSETFITSQAGAMTRYRPVLAGYAREAGGADYLRGFPTVVLAEHGWFPALERALLRSAGRVPRRWLAALAAESPTIVHAHFGSSAVPAGHIARALGVPLVVTYHGMDITVVPRSRAAAERRRAGFAAAQRVIAVSGFIADALRTAGCSPERITTHYIGVDTERFAPGGDRESHEVLFVGRLVEKKGVVHLLRAMQEVRRSVPESAITIAGDGPLRSPLAREAERLGVPVRFLGVQTPMQVRDLMRRASVLCGPSIADARGNAEGLPITFLEAQACGLPVVISASGGSAEGVVEGETGFVVPPADEVALASRLVELLRDPARRERMGNAARRHVVERFDLRKQTAALESLYDEVRAGGTSPPV